MKNLLIMLRQKLSKKQISKVSKFIVLYCFRNGPIEDLHDNKNGGSKISQEEMKEIIQ